MRDATRARKGVCSMIFQKGNQKEGMIKDIINHLWMSLRKLIDSLPKINLTMKITEDIRGHLYLSLMLRLKKLRKKRLILSLVVFWQRRQTKSEVSS
jgi:hypothetical protein